MLKYICLLILIGHSTLSYVIQPKAGCSIDITDLDPEPIVVTDDTYEFLYPLPNEDTINIETDQTVIISCPGGQLSIGSNDYTTVNANCVSGTDFIVEDETISFNSIRCSRDAFHTARYTGESCEADGKQVEIGYVLTDDTFARQITICFDDVNQTSLYSRYDLTKSIGKHESGVSRPSFIEDDFYNVGSNTVNELYERDGQRSSINGLLGLSSSSTKYIQNSGNYFLSRGHLTAKADFVYAPQQKATFHYVNVAPQWQTFNGANWNVIEEDVRYYAEDNELDLVVYTGTYGVTTLPHEETGEETELYLYVPEDGTKGIPVPELYWKLVHDPASKKGAVILGINNPYQTDVTKSIICEDVSDSITWLDNLKWDDLEQGYCYVCNVDDFRNTVTYAPNVDVSGGLLT